MKPISAAILIFAILIQENQDTNSNIAIDSKLAKPALVNLSSNIGVAIDSVCDAAEIRLQVPEKLYEFKHQIKFHEKPPVSVRTCLKLLLQDTEFDILLRNDVLSIRLKSEIETMVYSVDYSLEGYEQQSISTISDRIKKIISPNSWDETNDKPFAIKLCSKNKILQICCTEIVHFQISNFIELEKYYFARIAGTLEERRNQRENPSIERRGSGDDRKRQKKGVGSREPKRKTSGD